jgi:hypothetical protein
VRVKYIVGVGGIFSLMRLETQEWSTKLIVSLLKKKKLIVSQVGGLACPS